MLARVTFLTSDKREKTNIDNTENTRWENSARITKGLPASRIIMGNCSCKTECLAPVWRPLSEFLLLRTKGNVLAATTTVVTAPTQTEMRCSFAEASVPAGRFLLSWIRPSTFVLSPRGNNCGGLFCHWLLVSLPLALTFVISEREWTFHYSNTGDPWCWVVEKLFCSEFLEGSLFMCFALTQRQHT